jgi:hypothetical protein
MTEVRTENFQKFTAAVAQARSEGKKVSIKVEAGQYVATLTNQETDE